MVTGLMPSGKRCEVAEPVGPDERPVTALVELGIAAIAGRETVG
jgi:hypothetical protein